MRKLFNHEQNSGMHTSGAENLRETIGDGALTLAKGAKGFVKHPRLTAELVKAGATGDFSSEKFAGPEMVDLLAGMDREQTADIQLFPAGQKLILTNHNVPLGRIAPAITRRMSEGEHMPHIFADAAQSIDVHTRRKGNRIDPKGLVGMRLAQLVTTLPSSLPSIPHEQRGRIAQIKQEVAEVTEGRGRAFTPRELLREVKRIRIEKPDSSFCIAIEGAASRGAEMLPADEGLVTLANYMLRTDTGLQPCVLALNPETNIAHSFTVDRASMPEKPDGVYYENLLRQAMNETRHLTEEI